MASAIIIAGAFISLGGDNIYSIFKKDFKYGYIIPEERELYYAGWIADKFDEYINNPPKELLHKTFSEDEVNKKESCINSDEIYDYIAKEFNVKRFIYETGSKRSTENMKKIFDMNISEIPTDEMLIIMEKIKSDENSWIGKETVRAFSERNIEKTKEPNGGVVMNPDINGDYEEKIKIR